MHICMHASIAGLSLVLHTQQTLDHHPLLVRVATAKYTCLLIVWNSQQVSIGNSWGGCFQHFSTARHEPAQKSVLKVFVNSEHNMGKMILKKPQCLRFNVYDTSSQTLLKNGKSSICKKVQPYSGAGRILQSFKVCSTRVWTVKCSEDTPLSLS